MYDGPIQHALLTHKFTGQQRDTETGLDYMHFRYYSPQEGRFVSVDPGNAGAYAGDPQTWNGYSYVVNNPLSYTDPSGMFICGSCAGSIWGPVGAIVGGLIDLGLGLDVIFGGGGPSMPKWSDTAWELGPPLNMPGQFGDPWNENPGLGGDFGASNTGTLFGSGNTDPFIFSQLPSNTLKGNLQSALRQNVFISRLVGLALWLTGPLGYGVGSNAFVYHMEKSGGPWDFKDQPYTGAHPELDDFGNCHFGAISRAIGLPDTYARWAAGVASYRDLRAIGKVPPASWGRPWSGPPWGDNPRNQAQIRIGQETGNCKP
jgi:RHS repeat-associated protein